MNFAADRLHWARYAGRNFTDRQRIKRKAENWGRRYEALPLAERLAVLGAMMAVEAEAPDWQDFHPGKSGAVFLRKEMLVKGLSGMPAAADLRPDCGWWNPSTVSFDAHRPKVSARQHTLKSHPGGTAPWPSTRSTR